MNKTILISIAFLWLPLFANVSHCQHTKFLGMALEYQFSSLDNHLRQKGFEHITTKENNEEKKTIHWFRGNIYDIPCTVSVHVDNITKLPFRIYAIADEKTDTSSVFYDYCRFQQYITDDAGSSADSTAIIKIDKTDTKYSMDGLSCYYPQNGILLRIKSNKENGKTLYQTVMVISDRSNEERHKNSLNVK